VGALRRDIAGQTIVHAHGVFDLLHIGHIRHLAQAKELGDVLVVSLTPDRYVNKGPNRPAFTEKLRAEALAALGMVDYVVINEQPEAVGLIQDLQPDIFVKGTEFAELEDITEGVGKEAKAVEASGGRIEFVGDVVFSSSTLINQFLSTLTEEQAIFLESIRARYSLDEVLSWLERPANDVVAIVSEVIIDEYLFTQPLGQSSKDPILAVLREQLEVCPGGGLAIANHLAGFCREVHLVSSVGDDPADRALAQDTLRTNVQADFLIRTDTPTIRKRRLVDEYSGIKLLEIYEMNDRTNTPEEDNALQASIREAEFAAEGSLLVVADFGHGLISHVIANHISLWPGYLALNCQCNAGNRGLNSFKKYSRSNFICLAEKELNMEQRETVGDESGQLKTLANALNAGQAMLTRGKSGTLFHDAKSGIHLAPALASQVVDRVGAGDSVLAISSLLLKHQAPTDIISLVANAAGAIQVSELGNRKCLTLVTLSRFLTTLLK
jgi:rfaE bifunctional protein nucleotidyltransferase chain/domain